MKIPRFKASAHKADLIRFQIQTFITMNPPKMVKIFQNRTNTEDFNWRINGLH